MMYIATELHWWHNQIHQFQAQEGSQIGVTLGIVINAIFSDVNAVSYISVHTHAWSLCNRSDNNAESFA